MIAMQYKILLPDDYDMNNIRERVKKNGSKTDGFQDLLFKAYLISEKTDSPKSHNEYCPLYLWKDSTGMNKFIFNGFYNNILNSFGWQKIKIAIPLSFELKENFSKSKFVLKTKNKIVPSQQMKQIDFSINPTNYTGKILLYNPYEWICSEFYFYESIPKTVADTNFYRILHLSR